MIITLADITVIGGFTCKPDKCVIPPLYSLSSHLDAFETKEHLLVIAGSAAITVILMHQIIKELHR